jgi:murein L,D-transpeptidase YcbB/YkuD
MLKVITIAILLFFLFPSCKNAAGGNEKLPAEVANTAYLKNAAIPIDSLLLAEKPSSLKKFYRTNGFMTLWTNEADRKALHHAIEEAADDGLQPSDYNITSLLEFENSRTITKEGCVAYDILLTESFRKLATHLFKGKVPAATIYPDWALAPKTLSANKLLTEALSHHTIIDALNRCRPKHAVYTGLRKSLKYLNELPDDVGIPEIKPEKPIVLRDSGTVVVNIKKRLVYWKDLDVADAGGSIYNRKAMKAVKRFQERHGLYPNGIVDNATAEALNITKALRKEQVIANLERWRWFAYDFGERAIVINIPDYRMDIVENNTDTIDTYRVVVGKPDRRSPVLYSMLNYLVINPTWTVPPTILKEDLTPSATEDRGYFASHNMKIFYGRDTIETAPEDWDPQIADHYRYVQGPGSSNSLGLVKFNFRNSYSVYLHDTNHRELFSRSKRALSSGCVRVQDPLKLAGYVLEQEEKGWTEEKLQEIIAAGETQNVGLKKGTHVHQLYWTAWMDKGGLQFRNDIYNLDKALYDKLRK